MSKLQTLRNKAGRRSPKGTAARFEALLKNYGVSKDISISEADFRKSAADQFLFKVGILDRRGLAYTFSHTVIEAIGLDTSERKEGIERARRVKRQTQAELEDSAFLPDDDENTQPVHKRRYRHLPGWAHVRGPSFTR